MELDPVDTVPAGRAAERRPVGRGRQLIGRIRPGDEGVDEVASQFTSILNPSQLSKFLLWTDHNADAIEKLDYVNVGVGVENGPVFEFGVDEGMDGGE